MTRLRSTGNLQYDKADHDRAEDRGDDVEELLALLGFLFELLGRGFGQIRITSIGTLDLALDLGHFKPPVSIDKGESRL